MHKGKTKGAALIEYGLLIGLVSVTAIAAVLQTGAEVRDVFYDVAEATDLETASGGTITAADENTSGLVGPEEDDGTGTPSEPEGPQFTCSDDITIAGQSYGTVQIGTQCWMSENLNVNIPGSSCAAGNSAMCDAYGRLYPLSDDPDINAQCPEGWRIPFDEDWKTLEASLGMSPTEVDQDSSWRTSGDVGKQLATFVSGGTNSSGFNALPGGYAYSNVAQRVGTSTIFLTAGSAHWRYLRADVDGVHRRADTPDSSYKVYARCMSPLPA